MEVRTFSAPLLSVRLSSKYRPKCASRSLLFFLLTRASIFYTDRTAWVEMIHSDTATYMTLDVSIVKSPNQQLGIVFRQEFVADRYQVSYFL